MRDIIPAMADSAQDKSNMATLKKPIKKDTQPTAAPSKRLEAEDTFKKASPARQLPPPPPTPSDSEASEIFEIYSIIVCSISHTRPAGGPPDRPIDDPY